MILRLRLKRKTHPAFRVLNAFYFQTDFNLRFKRKRDVQNGKIIRVLVFWIGLLRSQAEKP